MTEVVVARVLIHFMWKFLIRVISKQQEKKSVPEEKFAVAVSSPINITMFVSE